MHHRVTAARAAYGRLRRILTSRSNLSLKARLGLWTTCVGTCLYYALDSSGITANGLQRVRVLVQKQLRAIARMPAHITHISNQDLLIQLGVEEPGAHILRNMQSLLDRWRANQNHECPIPVKAREDIGKWRTAVCHTLSEQLQLEQQAGRTRLQCPFCNLEFPTQTVLGSHISAKHAPASKPVFNRLRHSVNGEPRCSGCRTLLSSWARLQKQNEHVACPNPIGEPDSVSPTETIAVSPEKAQKTETAIPASADTASAEPLVLQSDVLSFSNMGGAN